MIFLAQLTARDVTNNELVTFYFTSGPGYFDLEGNFYEPRIEQPALMKRSFSDKGFAGGISETYGELTLVNIDGGLDHLYHRYMFAGQKMTLWVGNQDEAFDTFTKALVVTLYHPSFERERISFRIRDYSSTLDRPFLYQQYAGTNIGPDAPGEAPPGMIYAPPYYGPIANIGLEGDGSIKGTKKPRCLGRPFNVTPVLVNASLSIYQVDSYYIEDIIRVRDMGATLGREADYGSTSEMYHVEPSPGFYRALPSEGLFRVGTQPFGTVTACVLQYKDTEFNTAGRILHDIAGMYLGAGDFLVDDFSKLDEAIAANIGYYITGDETISEVIDRIALSVGAWWGFDNLGRFRVGRFDEGDYIYDSNGEVLRVTSNNILDFSTEELTFDGKPCPLYKVSINHTPNWTVQTPEDLAGNVSDNQKNWVGLEYRQSSREITGYQSSYPLSSEAVIDSLLIGDAYAEAEVERILRLFRCIPDNPLLSYTSLANKLLTVRVSIDSPVYYTIQLGSKIECQLDRFYIDDVQVRTYIVTSIETDYQSNEMSLTLYEV